MAAGDGGLEGEPRCCGRTQSAHPIFRLLRSDGRWSGMRARHDWNYTTVVGHINRELQERDGGGCEEVVIRVVIRAVGGEERRERRPAKLTRGWVGTATQIEDRDEDLDEDQDDGECRDEESGRGLGRWRWTRRLHQVDERD